MKFREKKEEPKVENKKLSLAEKLDAIEFDVVIGKTHADNAENCGYLAGEKAMLEKVKKLI